YLELFENDYQIIIDFYKLVPEDKYDFKLVDTPERKSDTPRESFAHILEVWLMYIHASKTGKLEFKDMNVKHYFEMSKKELLAEAENLHKSFIDYLTSQDFDAARAIDCPWGKGTAIG